MSASLRAGTAENQPASCVWNPVAASLPAERAVAEHRRTLTDMDHLTCIQENAAEGGETVAIDQLPARFQFFISCGS